MAIDFRLSPFTTDLGTVTDVLLSNGKPGSIETVHEVLAPVG